MNVRSFVLSVVLLTFLTAKPLPVTSYILPTQATASLEPTFQKAMSYATYANMTPEVYSSVESDESLRRMRQIGVEWVAINVVGWYQTNNQSVDIHKNPSQAPTDQALAHVIETAHNLNMKVMLKPMIDLEDGRWRGEIQPSDAWFQNYTSYINSFAEFAQQHSVEMLCVGTELTGTVSHETEWRQIVSGVRQRFTGLLTYAAVWGNEFDRLIKWWDALDYVGINAYFPLSGKSDPTIIEMKSAWNIIAYYLDLFYSKVKKPIIFTEIGYQAVDGTNKQPWDWTLMYTGDTDLQEQTDCYEAAFQALWRKSWLFGFYWWYWQTDSDAGGPDNCDYTPQNKPAQGVIAHWYSTERLLETTLTLEISEGNITLGESAALTATLRDENNYPISDANVTFCQGESIETEIGFSITNSSGVAAFTFQPGETGVLQLTAVFNGTPNHDASRSDSVSILVERIGTTLSLELERNAITLGEQATLTAELTDENNRPVSDMDVDFYLLGDSQTKIASSKTDSVGVATVAFSQDEPGIFQLQARFEGTLSHEASISDAAVLVVREPVDITPLLILGISSVAIVEAMLIGVLWRKLRSLSEAVPKA